ncbi:UNVERIFIED_CONTAM: hypothetical protein FKN15_028088 [Acipenser sinensis]
MRSACLILLASLTVCNLTVNLGQRVSDEGETEERVPLDEILQRAENLIIRSILKKMEVEDTVNGQVSPQQEWLSKRQHPGKRFQDDLEKRQHPGKRDEDEDTLYLDVQKRQHPGKREEEEDYIDVLKRQHPGKREDEAESYTEVQKRQHPGRRSLWDQYADIPSTQVAYLSELSKRQHPGKRYALLNKRQHPGRRSLDEELDLGELQDLEKRQHPGKRYLDSDSEYSNLPPCDIQDPATCSKASLLLELLDNVNKSRAEEKRQHPGRRLALEGGSTDLE